VCRRSAQFLSSRRCGRRSASHTDVVDNGRRRQRHRASGWWSALFAGTRPFDEDLARVPRYSDGNQAPGATVPTFVRDRLGKLVTAVAAARVRR
jgi:hypothetical protein